MLINYKTKNAHVKVVPLIPVSAEARKVRVSKSQIQLLPGNNYITDDEWAIMKDHLATEISNKTITVVQKTVEPSKRAPTGKAHNLREMPAGVAAEIIKDCTNPETLRKWYREETRDDILLHIVKKMKAVKIDPTDDDGKDDEGGGTNEGGSIDGNKTDGDNGVDDDDSNGKEFENMTKAELLKYAKDAGIDVKPTDKNDAIIATIKTAIQDAENEGGN